MFFDLSSMQPEDIDRAVESAQDYVNKKMQPADLVALVSLDTGLSMDQDFTSDHDRAAEGAGQVQRHRRHRLHRRQHLRRHHRRHRRRCQHLLPPTTASTRALNTDRELYAIQTIAKSLERVDQRKSMLYFSGGLTRAGHRKPGQHARRDQRRREG